VDNDRFHLVSPSKSCLLTQGSIFSLMLGSRRVGIARFFRKSIEKSFAHHPSSAEKLFQAYGITSDLPDDIAIRSIFTFATDIGFLAPAVSLARGWPGKAYVYHFNEPNPWDGEWKGDATHVLDVAFLFQNFNEFLPPAQKDVALIFARDYIRFVNGGTPWPTFESGNQGAMVYGPSLERSSAAFMSYAGGNPEESCGRRSTIFKLGEDIPFDELATAWGDFLAGQ
jgi:carboxylesterase type B